MGGNSTNNVSSSATGRRRSSHDIHNPSFPHRGSIVSLPEAIAASRRASLQYPLESNGGPLDIRRRGSSFSQNGTRRRSSVVNVVQDDPADPSSSADARNKVKRTKLEWKIMMMVCFVTFIEPFQHTLLNPILPSLTSRAFGRPASSVGTYVGLLTTVFCVTQGIAAVPVGLLSDRIGRKWPLVAGVLGNALGLVGMGLANTWGEMMAWRAFSGLVNSTSGVARSVVGEVSDMTNRGLAFAIWETAFGVGGIVGPLLTSLLSNPTRHSSLRNIEYFKQNPYSLPCYAGAALCAIGALVVALGLRETLAGARGWRPAKEKDYRTTSGASDSELGLGTTAVDLDAAAEKSPTSKSPTSTTELAQPESLSKVLFTPRILAPLLLYALWSLLQILHDEALALHSLPGLGLAPETYSLILTTTGATQLIVQALVYAPVERRVGVKGCVKIASIGMAVSVIGIGCVSDLRSRGRSTVIGVLAMWLVIRAVAIVFGFISIMILINNSAPSTKTLATVHGLGQVACSIARSIGPVLAGAIYTFSASRDTFPIDSHFPFLLTALLAAACWAIVVWLGRVEQRETPRLAETAGETSVDLTQQ
ncbi:hypothetical protein HDU85_003485 [Gaertneriomyces sp. JEL0708]|nr:hypothetical protein HDU85_003485 [Gaertneriomyces sp. JEL0708]